jgi:hypothetical protein
MNIRVSSQIMLDELRATCFRILASRASLPERKDCLLELAEAEERAANEQIWAKAALEFASSRKGWRPSEAGAFLSRVTWRGTVRFSVSPAN